MFFVKAKPSSCLRCRLILKSGIYSSLHDGSIRNLPTINEIQTSSIPDYIKGNVKKFLSTSSFPRNLNHQVNSQDYSSTNQNGKDGWNHEAPEGRNPGNEPANIAEFSLLQIQNTLESKAFPINFLKALRNSRVRVLSEPELFKGKSGQNLIDDIKSLSFQHFKKNQDKIVDSASKAHLAMSCLVLASYKVLTSRGATHDEAIHILHNSIVANIKTWMRAIIELPLFTNKQIPILTSFAETGIRLRGKSFHIELIEDPYFNAFLHVNVKKCFFNDFFNSNGASYLTGLFCAAEAKMLEGIDPLKYNIRVDIPRTLADGYKCCNFHFRKMVFLDDGEPKPQV